MSASAGLGGAEARTRRAEARTPRRSPSPSQRGLPRRRRTRAGRRIRRREDDHDGRRLGLRLDPATMTRALPAGITPLTQASSGGVCRAPAAVPPRPAAAPSPHRSCELRRSVDPGARAPYRRWPTPTSAMPHERPGSGKRRSRLAWRGGESGCACRADDVAKLLVSRADVGGDPPAFVGVAMHQEDLSRSKARA